MLHLLLDFKKQPRTTHSHRGNFLSTFYYHKREVAAGRVQYSILLLQSQTHSCEGR